MAKKKSHGGAGQDNQAQNRQPQGIDWKPKPGHAKIFQRQWQKRKLDEKGNEQNLEKRFVKIGAVRPVRVKWPDFFHPRQKGSYRKYAEKRELGADIQKDQRVKDKKDNQGKEDYILARKCF